MFRVFALFLLIIGLTSCNENFDADRALKEVLEASLQHNKEVAKDEFMNIQMSYTENPVKFKPIMRKAEKADSIISSFLESKTESFEKKNDGYKRSRKALLAFVNSKIRKNVIPKNVMFTEETLHYELLMKIELSRIHSFVNSYLNSFIDGYSGGWYGQDTIKIKNQKVEGNNYFSTLNSKWINNFNQRSVILDKVERNGSVIESPFEIKNNISIFDISADSLPSGKYSIKGRVLYYNTFEISEDHFTHEFEVK